MILIRWGNPKHAIEQALNTQTTKWLKGDPVIWSIMLLLAILSILAG